MIHKEREMSMSVETSDSPRFSAWSGLVRCLTNPTAAFAALADHPKPPFFLAYLVAGLCGLPMIMATTRITLEMVEAQLATQGLPPEAASITRAIGLGTAAVGGLFGPLLVGLLVAVLALVVGVFVGGGVGYRKYLSMIGYASLPSAIGVLIQGALAFGASTLTEIQQVSLSPAAFMPAGSSPLLLALLGLLNPFTLWYLYLAMIGFAALHRGRSSKGMAFVITLLLFQVGLVLWSGNTPLPQ